MAIISLYKPMSFIGKNFKIYCKMFSETNYMEQDSTENRLAWVKINRFSKYTISMPNYAVHNINMNARITIIVPSLY